MKYLVDALVIILLSLSSLVHEAEAAENNFVQCATQFHKNVEPHMPALRGNENRLSYLCYDEMAVLYFNDGKVPLYSAQVSNKAEIVKGYDIGRSERDAFHEEERIPRQYRTTLDDFKRLNRMTGNIAYDRGHLTASADMPTKPSEYQSFSLANIVPQNPSMNRGPWAEVEKSTRKYIKRAASDVYIVTGVLFAKNAQNINGMYIPTHLWKAVYDPVVNKGWVHIMPNIQKAVVSKPMGLKTFRNTYGIDVFNNADAMDD